MSDLPPGLSAQKFTALLKERRAELIAMSQSAKGARKPVTLDQQSVGRLSRQDALQQQAMANAQESRRQNDVLKIDRALTMIERGDYGWCGECGEAIALQRLELNLLVMTCMNCAKGAR